MEKNELLVELGQKLSSGEIKREEIISAIGPGTVAPITTEPHTKARKKRHFSITKILYTIGAAIVILGIGFLVAQVWNDIGSTGRVAVTLGLGILFAISGSVLFYARPERSVGHVFHTIGGVLIPSGAVVLLMEIDPFFDISAWSLATIFGILFVVYLILSLIHKKDVLTFFTVAYATSALYFLTAGALEDSSFINDDTVYAYLTMVVGLVYLILARGFKSGWNKRLSPSLYFLGSIAFLGGAFTRVFDSGLWQFVYFLLAFGGIALSVYLRSKAVLAISTIALVAHIVYITSEYFADSIGWPISLVILGFIVIGLGYGSVTINKKFISRKSRDSQIPE